MLKHRLIELYDFLEIEGAVMLHMVTCLSKNGCIHSGIENLAVMN